jgi:hypothetical protein
VKTPAIYALSGLLVSAAANATGVMPVFDLDFTRSANDTLKKIGITDACIIKATTPITFTYCRAGSSTLWKYQALDLDQLALNPGDASQAGKAYLPISVMEVDSAACLDEDELAPAVNTSPHWLVLGLIALFVGFGLRNIYRVFSHRRNNPEGFSQPDRPGMGQSLPQFDAMARTKALAAFSLAAVVAIAWFGYAGF